MSAEVTAVWCCSKCGAVYHKDFPRCPNDGAEVVLSMRDPLLDQTLGNYVIDRLIGEGGMGRVYAAHHATLAAKRYAIKVLLGDVAATGSMRKRFGMEAEAASRLDHPNIVGVLDYGEMPSGLPFIVMDYVDGGALTDQMDCPMDPARVIRLARAVCEGLAYAHAAGVVHRDLKPDNIMIVIGSDGSEIPRIADFGLATTIEPSSARLTTTGMAMGTPAYAAPEQMAGKRVDHKADLYSLGMTMFEMLTGGTLPFEGHPIEMMTAKAHREAPRVTEISPGLALPKGLEDLIASLIRRRSADRPEDARAVIAALDDIVLGLAVDERAATAIDDTITPASVSAGQLALKTEPMETRRRRRVMPWLFAATVVLAAGGGALWWFGPHARDAQPPAQVATAMPPVAAPPVAQPQPPAPAEHAPTPVEQAPPEIEVAAPPAESPAESRHRNHDKPRTHKERTKPAHAIAKVTPVVPTPTEVPAPPPPAPVVVPPPPPPPPPTTTIVTQIASVDVQGALSQAIVRRAVERVEPAVRQCAPATPQNVQVHFTIDESRRAQHVRASGAAPTTGCVVAALGGVRSESAPDTGDAEVDIKIAFIAK